jgi:hypothetical protein
MFEDSCFHPDLVPPNILVRLDEYFATNILSFLESGLVQLDPYFRLHWDKPLQKTHGLINPKDPFGTN